MRPSQLLSDSDRLQRVALALAQAVESRTKLPVIQRSDAAGLVTAMHAQLDEAIAHRDAEVGARIACRMGCNACCTSPVLVSEGEAIVVADWLRDHPDVRARFTAAYAAWKAALGDLVEQGSDESMQRAQQRHVMCAFNHAGACTIYPARPAVCRRTHALDTNEHCTSDTTPAQYYQHPETEELYEQQRPLRFALHRALRPNTRLELLCVAVHRLLGATGRNDACPCGSGKKYKKCCG